LSFVTQHDVELVHKIEELIGHQMAEFKTVESDVLKGITRVFAAKRAAALAAAEEDGVDEKRAKKIIKGNIRSILKD
jgi:ATP-dependent RNA helicase DDX49/DBP8